MSTLHVNVTRLDLSGSIWRVCGKIPQWSARNVAQVGQKLQSIVDGQTVHGNIMAEDAAHGKIGLRGLVHPSHGGQGREVEVTQSLIESQRVIQGCCKQASPRGTLAGAQ